MQPPALAADPGKDNILNIQGFLSMKSLFSHITIAALICMFCFAQPVRAEEKSEANISDILITTSKTHLLLFCTIKNSFNPQMIEGIKNGIPVTFTFLIELDKSVNNWFDTNLIKKTIQHTLTFDPLKEEFQVFLPERNNSTIATKSSEKAMELMTELNGIKIIERKELVPDAPYALRVKAKLAEKTLPMNMHYIVPFISLWDFETDWRTIEFNY